MISRARLFAALVFTLASVCALRASVASEDRVAVAVAGAPPNVAKAITTALSPWGIHVVAVSATISTSDVAAATAAARALAKEEDAGAIVWLAVADDGRASLWMYDSETEAVAVRPLTQPRPFDDASAAAIALSVKTLLRTTTMAPPRERAPAPAASASSVAPVSSASAAPSASASPAPLASAAPSASASQAPPSPSPAPSASSRAASQTTPARPTWRVEALVFGRAPTGANDGVAIAGGLAASFWPSVFGHRIGAGLDFLAGPSLDVSGPRFAGTFSDTSFGATVRARFDRAPLAIEMDLRPALHLTSLSGTSLATARALSVTRGDVSVGLFVVPELELGRRIAVGVPLGLDTFLRTQLYVLGDEAILRVPTFAFDFGGRVSLALD